MADRLNSEIANAVVETALIEKIQRLEQFVVQLRTELQRAREVSVDTMLGQLRLREAVLLYVGRDAKSFRQQIAGAYGCCCRGNTNPRAARAAPCAGRLSGN